MAVRDRINEGAAIGSRIFCAGNIVGFDGPFSQDNFSKITEVGGGVSGSFARRINAIWVENSGRHLMWMTPEQVASACRASENAGAAFVKTATGFLGRGASIEDVVLMRQSCSPRVQIKASGGVKTFAQAKALIEAGAARLGTSSGVALVTGGESTTSY